MIPVKRCPKEEAAQLQGAEICKTLSNPFVLTLRCFFLALMLAIALSDTAGCKELENFESGACMLAYDDWDPRAKAVTRPCLNEANGKRVSCGLLLFCDRRTGGATVIPDVPGIPEMLLSRSFTVLYYKKSEAFEDARKAAQTTHVIFTWYEFNFLPCAKRKMTRQPSQLRCVVCLGASRNRNREHLNAESRR